jgi:hypothetical protein
MAVHQVIAMKRLKPRAVYEPFKIIL